MPDNKAQFHIGCLMGLCWPFVNIVINTHKVNPQVGKIEKLYKKAIFLLLL